MKSAVRIAVIAPSVPAEFFDLLWEGIWSAVSELSSFGVQVDTFKTNGHDLDHQAAILKGVLECRYSAIAIIPAHASALNVEIGRHTRNGTHVITFNTDAPASERYSFVGPNARQGGALAGELLRKLSGGKGRYLSFAGLPGVQHFTERHDGMREELLREAPCMEEITCHFGFTELEGVAAKLFDRHPDCSGVFVGCSRVFQIGAVLKRLGLRIPCVGFNNTDAVRPLLEEGWVAAVIEESTYQQGYIALQRAYESTLSPSGPRSEWVCIPSTVVFRSNALDSVRGESLNDAFELLIRNRTNKLRNYQEQLEDANVKLLRLAETDALTGLLNRRKFEEILESHVNGISDHTEIALLMVDLDSFKAYNDSHGHHVGDEALRMVARILEKCSRVTDYCARLGGDEFCILLPGADSQSAGEVRSRILECIEDLRLAPQTLNLRLSLSIGVACMPTNARTVEDLIVAADQAMYAEKRIGRARLSQFEYAARA